MMLLFRLVVYHKKINLTCHYRYLQAKHGQEKVHGYLSKIMTFVLNLLTNTY